MCNLNLSTFPPEIKLHLFNFLDEHTVIGNVRSIDRSFYRLVDKVLGELFHSTYHTHLIATPPQALIKESVTEAQCYLYNKKIMGLIKKLWGEALAAEGDKLFQKLTLNHAKSDLPLTLLPVNQSRLIAVNKLGLRPLSFVPQYRPNNKPIITSSHAREPRLGMKKNNVDHVIYDFDPYLLCYDSEKNHLLIIEKNNLSQISEINLEDFGTVINSNKNFLYTASKEGRIKKYAMIAGAFSEIMSIDLKVEGTIEWMELVGENKQFWLVRSQNTLFAVDESSQKVLFQCPLEGKCLLTSKHLFYMERKKALKVVPVEHLLKSKFLVGMGIGSTITENIHQFFKGEDESVLVQDASGELQILSSKLEVLQTGRVTETISCFTSKHGLGAFGCLLGNIHIYSLEKESSFRQTLIRFLWSEITSLYWTDALNLIAATANGSLIYISPFPLKFWY